jgi:hypothetical protein
MQQSGETAGSTSRPSRKGLSTVAAAIILALVMIIGGVGAYFALSSVPTSTSTKTTCYPPTSATCVKLSAVNDVDLFVPYTVGFGQTYSQVAVGTSIPATVSVKGGEAISSYSVQWGPGIYTNSSGGSVSYNYGQTGLYTVAATATTPSGVVHTGLGQLLQLKVNPSSGNLTLGYFPSISTTLVNGTGGPYAWIGAGGTVTVTGTYIAAPADALFSTTAPTLTSTGGQQSGLTSSSSSVSATYTFANAGYYGITMVVPTTGPVVADNNVVKTLYQNFTWGVYVGASAVGLGCAACAAPVEASPHPGEFVNYEVIPGGALSLDPAADYYSVGYEVQEGFDESLIALNGTDSGSTYQNFVPEVATCVPGSPQCTSLYGNTLVNGSNFTFVIDPAAHFYDPTTKASREVYPTDVMFSIMRAMFGTQIFGVTGYYVGFDIAGPLIPYIGLSPNDVNASWDQGPGSTGLHAPYNTTPYWMYNSMSINDTGPNGNWCPAAAISSGNGCITFHADADNEAWPAILLILAIISADGIQAAGWYSAHGATVPGFVCSGADAPCLLPGSATSTDSTAFTDAVAAMSPTAFDPEETQFALGYPNPFPGVGFAGVGSGPYYLDYANPGVGYVLEANPAYQAPTGCKGQVGCLPNPGAYVPKVVTYWEPSDTVGISEVEAGYADTAGFETPDFPTMLSLVASGQLGLLNFPTLDTDNYGFNTQVDLAILGTIDSSLSPSFPANALAYSGLRAVLDYAYPYTTAQALGNVIDGIDGGGPFGGFLPPAESAYYNTQTPWPNYNNVSGVWSNPTLSSGTPVTGSAQWYWDQTYNNSGSVFYDSQLTTLGFTASNPLLIPVVGFTSAPNINAVEVAWGDSVSRVTGGVVQFQQFFVPSTSEIYTYTSPGSVPWAIWWFGWIPDYPAPVNNWQGAYGSGLWGGADALYQTFGGAYGGNYNDTAVCGDYYAPTMANLEYWAYYPNQVIPQVCQGMAWNVTSYWVTTATFTANAATAALLWDLIQDCYNNMQLTIGNDASNVVFTYAPWLNPATINTNVMIGGGAEWYYQELGGNNLY